MNICNTEILKLWKVLPKMLQGKWYQGFQKPPIVTVVSFYA